VCDTVFFTQRVDNMESIIRKLAKQTKNLNHFAASKEINGIKLFKNDMNLSKIQNVYLSYLYFYNTLNSDIMLKKVSEKVLDNEIYADAYYYYKLKHEDKKNKKDRNNKPRDVHLVFDNSKNFKEEK